MKSAELKEDIIIYFHHYCLFFFTTNFSFCSEVLVCNKVLRASGVLLFSLNQFQNRAGHHNRPEKGTSSFSVDPVYSGLYFLIRLYGFRQSLEGPLDSALSVQTSASSATHFELISHTTSRPTGESLEETPAACGTTDSLHTIWARGDLRWEEGGGDHHTSSHSARW